MSAGAPTLALPEYPSPATAASPAAAPPPRQLVVGPNLDRLPAGLPMDLGEVERAGVPEDDHFPSIGVLLGVRRLEKPVQVTQPGISRLAAEVLPAGGPL